MLTVFSGKLSSSSSHSPSFLSSPSTPHSNAYTLCKGMILPKGWSFPRQYLWNPDIKRMEKSLKEIPLSCLILQCRKDPEKMLFQNLWLCHLRLWFLAHLVILDLVCTGMENFKIHDKEHKGWSLLTPVHTCPPTHTPTHPQKQSSCF